MDTGHGFGVSTAYTAFTQAIATLQLCGLNIGSLMYKLNPVDVGTVTEVLDYGADGKYLRCFGKG